MSPATLLAARPMHLPAFETIPEMAPVLEYTSGGANNTSNNYRSPLSSLSSFSPARNSSTLALHLQYQDEDEDTAREKRSSFSFSSSSSSSSASSAFSASSPGALPRSQPPQLPPINTGLPLSAYPMYPGLQTSQGTAAMASTSSTATTTTTITTNVPSTTTHTIMTTTTTAAGRRGQVPRPLNRPRKISTAHARESSSMSTRASSAAYETPCSPQHYIPPYQSPTSASLIPRPRQRPAPAPPNELFGTLPVEVLDVILEWLQALHLNPPSAAAAAASPSSGGRTRSCATCWARDLCSLSLASRRWSAPARAALYRDVQLVGPDSAAHRKRFRLAQGCRMTLLRRTLRANPGLAATVRSLRVPAPAGETCDDKPAAAVTAAAAGGMSPREAYESRVAALIMACPNLEVLAGPAVATYEHGRFDRITHALSTRTKLKTMNWRIGPSTSTSTTGGGGGRSPSKPDSSSRRGNGVFAAALAAMLPPAPPPPLDAAQEIAFLDCHRAWAGSLTSLSVHCLPGAALAPATLLPRALACLPALQALHLCGLPADAFADAALLALPPRLRALTLSHVPGVTARGLSALATRPSSRGLKVLRLRHARLTSLPALARLLSHLPSLEDLAVVQDFAPLMPAEEEGGEGGPAAFALWMMPYLASRTLVRLHWDVAAGTAEASDADDILARSIEAGGFPALRVLRAPSDPGGIFQQLCRPLAVAATSADRIWANGGRCGSSHGRSASGSSGSGGGSGGGGFFGHHHHHAPRLPKSATAPSLPPSSSSSSSMDPFAAPHEPHATDLRAARIAAQARLDDARPRHRFRVQVHSQEGLLVDDFGLAGYVGTVGSPIRYCLSPDPGATDARGGLVDVPHLTSPGGELPSSCDEDDEAIGGGGGGAAAVGCTGSWNWREGVVLADRKEKETWWHTERGRWIRPSLD